MNILQLFKLKCINNMLPVLEKLKQRKQDLYTSDKCIIYKKETENVEHLASCEVSINLVREIEEQEVESTLIEFKETVNIRKTKE